MGKIIVLLSFLIVVLASCKKDTPDLPCSGVDMTQNSREVFVGTWRWYKTTVREWFDVGSDYFHDYTSTTEGFEFYFTISEDGYFKSYRDGILEDQFLLSYVNFELDGESSNVLALSIDCTVDEISLDESNLNTFDDSITVDEFPLNFYNSVEKRESVTNFFIRE